MPLEHKKRVFNAWEQMTYITAKEDARISIFNVNTHEVKMDIKIYVDCIDFKKAVNDLKEAFANCRVEYKVIYGYNVDAQRRYIHIIAKA